MDADAASSERMHERAPGSGQAVTRKNANSAPEPLENSRSWFLVMSLWASVVQGDLPLCDSLLLVHCLLRFLLGVGLGGATGFAIHVAVSAAGHLLLALLYRHAVATIFNAEVPACNRGCCSSREVAALGGSYREFYKLLRLVHASTVAFCSDTHVNQ